MSGMVFDWLGCGSAVAVRREKWVGIGGGGKRRGPPAIPGREGPSVSPTPAPLQIAGHGHEQRDDFGDESSIEVTRLLMDFHPLMIELGVHLRASPWTGSSGGATIATPAGRSHPPTGR